MFSSILFVCVGNICRSPMAQGLSESFFSGRRIESAGLSAVVGSPPDPPVLELLKARGIDISAHRARQLTADLIQQFEVVFAMETWHVREIERISPAARGRIFRLGHWGDFEIPDPYRQDRQAFERAFAAIERGLADVKSTLRID